MSNLVIITFDNPDTAAQAYAVIKDVAKMGKLKIQDSAVLVKDANGKVSTDNRIDRSTVIGAVTGGLLAPLLFFAFPVAGIAIGAAGGALVGKSLDRDVDKKLINEVRDTLPPGSSALFLLGSADDPAIALAALRGDFHGKVYQSTLSPELQAELEHALK
jgi:uncharacterized membrane protein